MKKQPSFYQIHKGQEDPTVDHEFDRYGEGVKESIKALKRKRLSCYLKHAKPDLDLACLIVYGVYTGARLEEIGEINRRKW